MENKEIMERLLQNDKPSKASEKAEWANVKANDRDVSISRIRVVTAKYKVYIVLLLIFIALFSLNYIPSATNSYDSSQSAYKQVNTELSNLQLLIQKAKGDMVYLCDEATWVAYNENNLKDCLNSKTNCASLPDTWKIGSGDEWHYDLSIPLSYLQLHSLYNKKMPVDEKRVLKNLNEYLIKENISWWERSRVWDILKIEIGDPEAVKEWDNHFFQVPVDVEIEFETVDGLIWFLYNVEKKLIEEWEDRILYKIQTVSYDIVSRDEPQVTDISMIAYYYHDEKFNDQTITILANVSDGKVKLRKKEWSVLPNNLTLKEQIKSDEKIQAKDLFEMPERIDVNFKDWKWIDISKKWEDQELSVEIKRKPECDPSYLKTDSNEKTDDWLDSEDSVSLFDKILGSLKL